MQFFNGILIILNLKSNNLTIYDGQALIILLKW